MDIETQVVFSYSWNEHSVGGAICPTMGKAPDYTYIRIATYHFSNIDLCNHIQNK